MALTEPEKEKVKCPECGAENEVLYFPSNRSRVELPGTRAGKTIVMRGRGEKVEGKCAECNYKFSLDNL